MLEGLLDLIFPPACAGCDAPGVLLCSTCRDGLPLIDAAAACPRCGAPVPASHAVRAGAGAVRVRCAECHGRSFAFSEARCAARLEPPVSRAIVMLKDSGERRYACVLGELLVGCASGWLSADDVLVPVPASPAALRRRGFDHSADIAQALGALTGFAVRRLLYAERSADQRALGREQRFANRVAAFRLAERSREGVPSPHSVVLIDDVFTTGATLDAAARVLASAGVRTVRALAVARSLRPAAGVGPR